MSTVHTAGQRKAPLAESAYGKEAGKDTGGAGPETGAVPFPQQKVKGQTVRVRRMWVAPRSIVKTMLSSHNDGMRAFIFVI